jgi:hypothetical protein
MAGRRTRQLRVNVLRRRPRRLGASQLHDFFHDSREIAGKSACSFVRFFVIAQLRVVCAAFRKLHAAAVRREEEQ